LEETHLTLLTKNHVATLKSSERSKLWIGGTQPKKEVVNAFLQKMELSSHTENSGNGNKN
jgi:hypothetical protein